MEVLISLKSVFETSVQQLALSVIKWPSWGAVWPSGWVVTTNPGGRASPGANHLPWEWSKLPNLAGGRSQQNMTKLCEKLIYQVGPSHLCNKVAGYCHSWASCPIRGTFMTLYVPLIHLQLSGVGFEKTWAAVKDWTQLGHLTMI